MFPRVIQAVSAFSAVLMTYRDRLTGMEEDVEDILRQEKTESIMRASENQVHKPVTSLFLHFC